ncbi:MAG: excinuclease ABC subunit UvrB [Metamycoplasmataceae bacterium]
MENKDFKIFADNKPAGDQINAIKELIKGIYEGKENQVLLGVTGSGKTFTIANVIEKINRPVIVLSHNKTLASQLYSELKTLFKDNRVEYFVSYFDHYRPEAYLPSKDVYIEKTSKNNHDLEAMRISTLNALTTRRDTIVVASVASIYGTINPEEYKVSFLNIEKGQTIKRSNFFIELIKRQYTRNNISLESGNFSSKGDVVEISPGWTNEFIIRIDFFDDTIENIYTVDSLSKNVIKSFDSYTIFPASAYIIQNDTTSKVVSLIKEELDERLLFFKNENKRLEYERLLQRTNNDIDSLQEFGFCSGIENYSRHIDGRQEGEKPFTLLDFLPKDALMIIDESHMMIPQLNAMHNGDRARKLNLVEYGFRLPSALDNRPLRFSEFFDYDFQKIFVSATPAEFELNLTSGEVVSQIIRPTGLLDPVISIIPEDNQVESIYDQILKQRERNERSLILTTTKKTSEAFTKYFKEKNVKIAYIHSDHKTFERNEILRKLRKGIYEVVIGINLLREGIDLPEVSLIMVLDANKESFFRSKTSLIQIVGRAARNSNGRVIFFANTISKSMQETINDNQIKREIQINYNKKNNIIPSTIIKPIAEPINGRDISDAIDYVLKNKNTKKAQKEKDKIIESLREEMILAAKELNFEKATELRDLILEIEGDE